MMRIGIGIGIAFLASLLIERAAVRPGAPPIGPAGLPARLLLVSILFGAWLSIFGRPFLAGLAALVTLAVLTAISIRKRQLVAEPLVFSDFGLVRMIIRHPDLYYLGFMRDPRFLGASAFFALAVVVWIWLETPIVSPAGALALGLGIALAVASAWRAAASLPAAGWLARRMPRPTLESDVGRWGLVLTLVAYALRWRGELAAGHAPREGEPRSTGTGPAAIVVVQFESFADPVRLGLASDPLPELELARARAVFHGPLAVPTHGAFTMRSEHEVLTGLPGRSAFWGFDPYLSGRAAPPPSLAATLRGRGYRTVFIHPFRAGFFNREAVMPRLGFAECLWEADFAGAERFGPYVSDGAVADRIVAELRRCSDAPTMIMAVTMENHGPWSEGRLSDEPDPVRQYLRHLANSDRAITRLIEGLSVLGRPVLLCVYGDHPPILPGVDPAAPPETCYAVIEIGGPPHAPVAEQRRTTYGLGLLMGDLASGRPPRDA